MNNQSSNNTVETQLKILSSIKSVNPRSSLFEATMQRIAVVNDPKISMHWVRAAAVVFVLVLCGEFIILSSKSNSDNNKLTQQEQLESLVPQIDYTLYND